MTRLKKAAQKRLRACILITPSVLHVESEETIIIDAQKIKTNFIANIEIKDFPLKTSSIVQTSVTINGANEFLGQIKIKIPSASVKIDTTKNIYVNVILRSNFCNLEKVLLLSFQSGYLFIQTDKTIYTPESQVLYRIFPTNFKLQQMRKSVTFEILTPSNVTVFRDSRVPDSNGIISMNYKLPEIVEFGAWSISANYDDTPLQNHTTNFEVKEYVLPIFEVKLLPRNNFLYVDDETFELEITANYLYGEPVYGMAFVLFGVKKNDEKTVITKSLRTDEIVDGKGSSELKREHLVEIFKDPKDMKSYRLFVTVTVITQSGTDLVEAELDDIYIVESPYKVLFTKTSKYFKPGMTFDLTLFVSNPDGSPASNIPVVVNSGEARGVTSDDGTTKIRLNSGANERTLHVTAKTEYRGLTPARQATATMTFTAYRSLAAAPNYLHIGVSIERENILLSFTINNDQNSFDYFTYMIMNKGRIALVGRQSRGPGQNLVSKTLSISEDFIPSFRIVAYYVVKSGIVDEIVSDSVWVKVSDRCMGTLKLEANSDRDKMIQSPDSTMSIKVTADHKASVALVAVDKGVFVLNKKFKLTQRKVWDNVDRFDIGCTPGGGADSVGVFYDAGLALETNIGMTTPSRTDQFCEVPKQRKRRSTAALIQAKTTKASIYKGLEKQCCLDGMKDNPMGHSCERRSAFIQEKKPCVDAFLDCCNYMKKKREIERELKGDDVLARSIENEDYFTENDIEVRSDFRESFLWKVEQMTDKPNIDNLSSKAVRVNLPSSITTWEVLAVSLSENKGICVSQPYDILVMKKFFIDLRLPYSVVRNEQVEIRAVVYNYAANDMKIRVQLTYSTKFCSLSTSRRAYQQDVEVRSASSNVASFVIIPLVLGLHDIEVKAVFIKDGISDGVRKKLKVVPEGVRRTVVLKNLVLDPKGKTQMEDVPALKGRSLVPDTDILTLVTFQGSPISEMLEDAIDGSKLGHLIIAPGGCGEQNMVKMTKCVIVTRYLDATGQWDRVGVDRRKKAIDYIQQGYTTEQVYRKDDGSYAIFKRSKSSTWLTAYVVKVFAMASEMVYIDKGDMCGSVRWLILNRQKPDGLFKDETVVSEQYLTGGLEGSTDPESALTAFVLIAMLESKGICASEVNNLQFAINQASNFLLSRYNSLRSPYSVAITSYALALAGRLDNVNVLLSVSTDKTHWIQPDSDLVTLEATGYALLALLQLKQFHLTDAIVQWINERRFYGVPYSSTQETIIMLQALSEYQKVFPPPEDLSLDVTFTLPGRSQQTTYRVNKINALLSRSDESKINGDFRVQAKGKGQATMLVTAMYYEITTEKEKECNTFFLSVTTAKDEEANLPKGAEQALSVNICYRHLKEMPATMSILDISMMTGFSPDVNSLNRLMDGVDKYISRYELDKGVVDKSNLLIYLNGVSRTEDTCIKITLFQHFKVGLIQPGSVTLYDYYNPKSRCTKFYHVNEDSKLLGKICKGEECRCAEGNCVRQQKGTEEITALYRYEQACAVGVDYVYKATPEEVKTQDNYNTYVMKILEIFKAGTDIVEPEDKRDFISHVKCKDLLDLKTGKNYLMWGVSTDLWQTKSGYSYIVGNETWVEWWPTDIECQDRKNQKQCDDYFELSETLSDFGCSS
ncbi:complement C3 [Pelobates cultripes]|uniref:Complement C3 n=3 Tax=Pelobates cultripes TaxID=61616 RepID=A0AAD1RKC6_PELCU|nr:complement C3 [Pelobates cultripes]